MVIDVNAADVIGGHIPRTIFGTFLEPIRNATYGGLWAEILENPSFEAGLWSPQKIGEMLRERPESQEASELALPLPWEPLNLKQGNRYEVHLGDAANSWQSLPFLPSPVTLPASGKESICQFIAPAATRAASTRSI